MGFSRTFGAAINAGMLSLDIVILLLLIAFAVGMIVWAIRTTGKAKNERWPLRPMWLLPSAGGIIILYIVRIIVFR